MSNFLGYNNFDMYNNINSTFLPKQVSENKPSHFISTNIQQNFTQIKPEPQQKIEDVCFTESSSHEHLPEDWLRLVFNPK